MDGVRRPRTALFLFAALAFAGSAFWASTAAPAPVSAHDTLAGSTPGDGESITADPGAVTLTFSDDLLSVGGTTDGFAVQVVDSEGLHFESGCLTLDGVTVTAPIALGDAGGYQVLWQVVSSDGHPTSGQYGFDYEPASIADAHDGLTQPAVCGDPWAGEPDGATAATPTPSEAAAPTPATDAPAAASVTETFTATETAGPAGGDLQQAGAALPWPIIVLIVVVGLGVIAAIVVLTLRRTRDGGFGGS